MPSFKNFLQKAHQNTTKFFNSTLPSSVRQGVRFFNSSVIPAARKVHQIHGAVTKELTDNPHVGAKVKTVATKSSAFADLGLGKLTQAGEAIGRVAGQLGVD